MTDTEKRIFLAAFSREKRICEDVDKSMPGSDGVFLVPVCESIKNKVMKSDLWKDEKDLDFVINSEKGILDDLGENKSNLSYDQGINAAWSAVKKIFFDLTYQDRYEIFGYGTFLKIILHFSPMDVIKKIQEFEDSQKCNECENKDSEICDGCVDNVEFKEKSVENLSKDEVDGLMLDLQNGDDKIDINDFINCK